MTTQKQSSDLGMNQGQQESTPLKSKFSEGFQRAQSEISKIAKAAVVTLAATTATQALANEVKGNTDKILLAQVSPVDVIAPELQDIVSDQFIVDAQSEEIEQDTSINLESFILRPAYEPYKWVVSDAYVNLEEIDPNFVVPSSIHTIEDFHTLLSSIAVVRDSSRIQEWRDKMDILVVENPSLFQTYLQSVNAYRATLQNEDVETVNPMVPEKIVTSLGTIITEKFSDMETKKRQLEYAQDIYTVLAIFTKTGDFDWVFDLAWAQRIENEDSWAWYSSIELTPERIEFLLSIWKNISMEDVLWLNKLHEELLADVESALDYYSELLHLPVIEWQEETLLEIWDIVRAGIQEQIQWTLLSEKYVTGRYSEKTDEWKEKKAKRTVLTRLNGFFKWVQNSSSEYLLKYSPEFTQNLLNSEEQILTMNPSLQWVFNKLSVTQSKDNIVKLKEINKNLGKIKKDFIQLTWR